MGVVRRARTAVRSDEALLERAQRGDTACFEEFYRRHKAAVFGYCLVRLADRQAAEDAMQEIFLKAHAATDGPVRNAKAWLFAVAHNAVIDVARRRRAVQAHVGLEYAIDEVASDFDESAFSAMDVSTNVFIALRRLPARDRKALVLRDFHDRSSQQIADELKMRAGSVDVLLCRARAALGRAYAEVSAMPFACRQNTELIYRETGSGITDRQRQLMDAHLVSCRRCAAEYARMRSPRFLAAFLPWLWLRLEATGLARPFNKLETAGASVLGSAERLPLSGLPVAAKAAIGVVVTAAILTPGVADRIARPPAPPYRSALVQQGPVTMKTKRVPRVASAGAERVRTSADDHDVTRHEATSLHAEAHPKALSEEKHDSSATKADHTLGTSDHADSKSHSTAAAEVSGDSGAAVNEVHDETPKTTHTEPDEPHE